ncbi:MAG TPA: DUF4384 domain-containing protein [Candidatus Odoribacter faecigallinarum]|uniref:DUF4384 domain-containing protein n=1 Tax=Candidatus Odoribacter faecigallinarum TaxID=2838706 RepID=A0A9D1V0H4_9BACT|nr:DUF4384 domain-containing protein [Candidatus Odoribacter faecigallinarum]
MGCRLLFSVCFILGMSLVAVAQKTERVTATYTYYAPEHVSIEEARRVALQRAQLQAIADAFGTIVTQTNATTVKNENGKSDVSLLSLGASEVKGEWLRTDGEPEYEIAYEDGMLAVTVRVKGVIREIVNAAVDFQARVLCNGTEDRFEQDRFRNGDDLYLSFQSPVDGYLTVYLLDAEGTAYCLLPYRGDTGGRVAVKGNRRYVFFSVDDVPAGEQGMVDEYVMTCGNGKELNQIYVIFSPQLFTKAVDYAGEGVQPRELPYEEFQQWLFNCRKQDREMRVEVKHIVISD